MPKCLKTIANIYKITAFIQLKLKKTMSPLEVSTFEKMKKISFQYVCHFKSGRL